MLFHFNLTAEFPAIEEVISDTEMHDAIQDGVQESVQLVQLKSKTKRTQIRDAI